MRRWAFRIVFTSALAGWMALIFNLSSLPDERVSLVGPQLGQYTAYDVLWFGGVRSILGHVLLFGIVSLLVNLAFARTRVRGRELGVPLCTGLLLVAITLEEYSQKLVPNRDFSMTDLGASFAGALVGAAIAWITLARRASKQPSSA